MGMKRTNAQPVRCYESFLMHVYNSRLIMKIPKQISKIIIYCRHDNTECNNNTILLCIRVVLNPRSSSYFFAVSIIPMFWIIINVNYNAEE
jgi:hypothetical protein